MTLNDYQKLAYRTSNPALTNMGLIENGVMGLCGEAGECIDIVKKAMFQGHKLDREKLIDELSDTLWYAAQLATGLDISLDDVAQHNVDKLMKRYPYGFDSERSVHRPEYEGGSENG